MPVQSRYPRSWAWPGNANIAMSIGLAFEAFQYHSQYSHTVGKEKPISSRFPMRTMAGNQACGACSTCSMRLTSRRACRPMAWPLRAILTRRAAAEAGHEIVGHGWVNDILMQTR